MLDVLFEFNRIDPLLNHHFLQGFHVGYVLIATNSIEVLDDLSIGAQAEIGGLLYHQLIFDHRLQQTLFLFRHRFLQFGSLQILLELSSNQVFGLFVV